MRPLPDIDLSRLREIGCANWDAMPQLSGSEDKVSDYDGYLIEAASRLCRGAADDDVADYLIFVETECIGMDSGSGMRERALAVVEAIRDYVASIGCMRV